MIGLVVADTTLWAAAGDAMPDSGRKTILFVPLDSRPITSNQTVASVKKLGYKILTPPAEYLGTKDYFGNPDGIWDWLDTETSENQDDILSVVISCDSVIYGSLVASRMHDFSNEILTERVRRFVDFHDKFPEIKIYAYSSIMRTLRYVESGVENKNYEKLGDKFFRYTVLLDKKELGLCNYNEKLEFMKLRVNLPMDLLNNWLVIRTRNFMVNRQLIMLANLGYLTYLGIGRDDNAPFSQTHRESRRLNEYSEKLVLDNFENLAGLDEYGLVMLMRAINDANNEKPAIFVEYNKGVGGDTIPLFSDEPVKNTIKKQISVIGGVEVDSPEDADLVLLVNTPEDGKSINHYVVSLAEEVKESDSQRKNRAKQVASALNFVKLLEDYVAKGYKIAVADIAQPNGADDALLNNMRIRRLLFRLNAYSGWNTATNSTGYALAQGLIANKLSVNDKTELLLTRYVDDWIYQRIVRTVIMTDLAKVGSRYIWEFGDKKELIEEDINDLMHAAILGCLPPFEILDGLSFTNPWNRMFETDISF